MVDASIGGQRSTFAGIGWHSLVKVCRVCQKLEGVVRTSGFQRLAEAINERLTGCQRRAWQVLAEAGRG